MYCNYCGHPNPDDSKFCSQCGKQLSMNCSGGTNTSLPKKHKVVIFRESQLFLVNPPVNITLDGQQNRSIGNGQTVVLELDEGSHDFIFSMSFRKRPVSINLTRDMQITLSWDRITGALKASVI